MITINAPTTATYQGTYFIVTALDRTGHTAVLESTEGDRDELIVLLNAPDSIWETREDGLYHVNTATDGAPDWDAHHSELEWEAPPPVYPLA